ARAQTDTTSTPDTSVKRDSTAHAATPNGICLTCGPNDSPPSVTITPSTSTFGSSTQTNTIDWCDDNALAASTRQITFNGVSVTSQFTYTDVVSSRCGDGATSVGSVTLKSGTNTFVAQIKDGAAQLGSDNVTYTFTQLVSVTPDAAPLTGYAKMSDTAAFTVKNTTSTSASYTLSTACPTGWSCTGPPAAVTLNAGLSTQVKVLYTPPISGTAGTIALTATPTTSPSSADHGSYVVTVPVTVSVKALAGLEQLGYALLSDEVVFTVANSGPAAATFGLSEQCTGTATTSCTVAPSLSVPAGATELASVTYTPGDSNQVGTVKLAVTGGDPGDTASATVGLTIKGSEAQCDTTSLTCQDHGDRTPPVIAIRPSNLTQSSRYDTTLVVDWCDNFRFGQVPGVIMLNGIEMSPPLPDSAKNTTTTCDGGAMEHSMGSMIVMLPGLNTIEAERCDEAGNCGDAEGFYTYPVLDIATADSALLRRGAGSTFLQAFRVKNIGHEQYVFTLAGACTGPGVSASGCTIVGATSDTLAPGQSQVDTVSYQTPSTAAGQTGTVSLAASPVLNPKWSASGSVKVHAVTPVVAIAATPDGVAVPIADSLVNTYDFWVRDAGNVRESLTLALACTGVTACGASPTSVTLAPNDSARVTATFTGGAAGSSGSVKLSAASGSVVDTA